MEQPTDVAEEQEFSTADEFLAALPDEPTGEIVVDLSPLLRGEKPGSATFTFRDPDIREIYRLQERAAERYQKQPATPIQLHYQMLLLSETHIAPPIDGDKLQWFKRLAMNRKTVWTYILARYYFARPDADIDRAVEAKKK